MTAINTAIQTSPVFSSPASSVAAVRSGGAQASAPVVTEQVSQQSPGDQPSVQDVKQAVQEANASIQGSNESITFGYEEQLGQLVVQISDKTTGKVIQQLPSKDFIQFQLHMRAMVGLFLDKKA